MDCFEDRHYSGFLNFNGKAIGYTIGGNTYNLTIMDPKPFKSTVYNAGAEGVKKIVRTAEGWVKDIITEKIKVVVDLSAIYKAIKDYVDQLFLTITIPDAQIQSDWTQDDNGVIDYIKNKRDYAEFTFKDLTPGTAQIYDLDIDASGDYTVDNIVLEVDDGTLTGVAVKINTTDVTSLSSVTVDTTKDKTTATGANDVVSGDRVTLVTSTGFTGAPTTLTGKINFTWK